MKKRKEQKINERKTRKKRYETYKLFGGACMALVVTIITSLTVKLVSYSNEYLKWLQFEEAYPEYVKEKAAELFLTKPTFSFFDGYLTIIALAVVIVLLICQQKLYTKALEFDDE